MDLQPIRPRLHIESTSPLAELSLGPPLLGAVGEVDIPFPAPQHRYPRKVLA